MKIVLSNRPNQNCDFLLIFCPSVPTAITTKYCYLFYGGCGGFGSGGSGDSGGIVGGGCVSGGGGGGGGRVIVVV